MTGTSRIDELLDVYVTDIWIRYTCSRCGDDSLIASEVYEPLRDAVESTHGGDIAIVIGGRCRHCNQGMDRLYVGRLDVGVDYLFVDDPDYTEDLTIEYVRRD